jgi:hypothetical protein
MPRKPRLATHARDADTPTTVVARQDGRVLRKMAFYLDEDVARRFKVQCVLEGRDMSEVLGELVAKYLRERRA